MEEVPTPNKKNKVEDYEIEGWADTLMRAEEIKADPEKMKMLQPHLKRKVKAYKKITSLADLKEVAARKMYSKEDA